MKTATHPEYFTDAKTVCSCGNVIHAGSTIKDQHTEICSNCHPFYTGKQKLIDTAGRVDKFRSRMEKAKAFKETPAKKETPAQEKKPAKTKKRSARIKKQS